MTSDIYAKPLLLHPTDFSPGSEVAFAHALRIALGKQSGLKILHVGDERDEVGEQWKNFPHVRQMLTKWGLLDADVNPTEVYYRLGISVQKVEMKYRSVMEGIIDYGRNHESGIDMLVLHSEGRQGLPRWLEPSRAEAITRELNLPALFVSDTEQAMINPDDGQMDLGNILVPVDYQPDARIALGQLGCLFDEMDVRDSIVTLLHVGDEAELLQLALPENHRIHYKRRSTSGEPVEQILAAADDINARMIVMATHGHDGFLDVLRGNTSERVLRSASCPVLTIPV